MSNSEFSDPNKNLHEIVITSTEEVSVNKKEISYSETSNSYEDLHDVLMKDAVDAAVDLNILGDSTKELSPEIYFPVPKPTISAGKALFQHESLYGQPAGEVMKNIDQFLKRDIEIDINDILPVFGDHANEETDKPFNLKDASESIKHFFKEEAITDVSENLSGDQVDAYVSNDDNEVETPVSYKSFPGISTSQGSHKCIIQNVVAEKEYHYNMNHPERGCFVIFNQEKFDLYNRGRPNKDKLGERTGTLKDAENLENTARQLGFEYVKTFTDYTKEQIEEMIFVLSKADHSNYDCFGCAVLTHGSDRDILYARDAEMKLTDFTRSFGADKCRSLASKPKLFFINACRGDKIDGGGKVVLPFINFTKADTVDSVLISNTGSTDVKPKVITIPAEADFLIANSTCPEYYSFRNITNGSIFIQNLCAVFNCFGDTMELMQMMTRVNRMVAYDFTSNSNIKDFDEKKQIPSIATRLTAEVYFKSKHVIMPNSDVEIDASIPSSSENANLRTESTIKTERVTSHPKYFYPQHHPHQRPPPGATNSQRIHVSDVQVTSTPIHSSSNQDVSTSHQLEIPDQNVFKPTIKSKDGSPSRTRHSSENLSKFHKSPTEPAVAILRQPSVKRNPDYRRSFPETKRLVRRPSDLQLVGGRKINKSYEESEL